MGQPGGIQSHQVTPGRLKWTTQHYNCPGGGSPIAFDKKKISIVHWCTHHLDFNCFSFPLTARVRWPRPVGMRNIHLNIVTHLLPSGRHQILRVHDKDQATVRAVSDRCRLIAIYQPGAAVFHDSSIVLHNHRSYRAVQHDSLNLFYHPPWNYKTPLSARRRLSAMRAQYSW